MKQLVEYPLEEGGSILVEVTIPEGEAKIQKAGLQKELPIKAAITFEAALNTIRPVVNAVISKFDGLKKPPDEVEVQFKLGLKTGANAVLASLEADTNLQLTLKWMREK
ncbi:MAG: hypothetical protein JW999_10120 [Methanotrichaceae archaeon]|nr:hypothetical protein [Methanotrichaceae archaeon]